MPKHDDEKDHDYKTIVKNRKFRVEALDPKEARRDNVRLTYIPTTASRFLTTCAATRSCA